MPAETHQAYIGVGSNISPRAHIERAFYELGQKVRIVASSLFYSTAPLDGRNQNEYLNGVWKAMTGADARTLKFEILRPVEDMLGRVRRADKFSSRSLDLDLLLFDNAVIREPDLQVPDPDIYVRSFIVLPLLELDPDLVLPDTRRSLRDVAAAMNPGSIKADVEFSQKLKEKV